MVAINIETDRLILKNLNVEDISIDYVNWLNDPNINKYLNSAGSVQTMESCTSYVESFQNIEEKSLLGIWLKKESLHIGNLTLSLDIRRNLGVTGVSLGRRECMGKGLGMEALVGLRNYCFEQIKLHRLEAYVSEKNIDSTKLFLRSGFKVEGLLRESELMDGKYHDAYLLSVLESDL
jgi:[ribosomal protein S5]-alanine N-acetyltransferase